MFKTIRAESPFRNRNNVYYYSRQYNISNSVVLVLQRNVPGFLFARSEYKFPKARLAPVVLVQRMLSIKFNRNFRDRLIPAQGVDDVRKPILVSSNRSLVWLVVSKYIAATCITKLSKLRFKSD